MENVKISVIVPGYNVESYIRECLNSILEQTLDGIQVIMVNDGSIDATPQIMNEYAGKYDNFQVIHQENGGLSNARNVAISLACGKYLAFVDGDDIVPKNAYEKMYTVIEKTKSDMITGHAQRFNSLGVFPSGLHEIAIKEIKMKTHIVNDHELFYDTSPWNKLFRREFWNRSNLKFPENMLWEDGPSMLAAHYLAKSVDIITDFVYLWRIREGSDTSITQRKHEIQNFRDRIKSINMIDNFLKEHHVPTSLKDVAEFKIISNDLMMYINLLHVVDDEYRQELQLSVSKYLEIINPITIKKLHSIQRIKYRMIQENKIDKLVYLLKNPKLLENPKFLTEIEKKLNV